MIGKSLQLMTILPHRSEAQLRCNINNIFQCNISFIMISPLFIYWIPRTVESKYGQILFRCATQGKEPCMKHLVKPEGPPVIEQQNSSQRIKKTARKFSTSEKQKTKGKLHKSPLNMTSQVLNIYIFTHCRNTPDKNLECHWLGN